MHFNSSKINETPLVLSNDQLSTIVSQIESHPYNSFYTIYDYLIETKPKHEHLNSHDIYLVGHHQLDEKIKIFAGFEHEQLYEKLKDCRTLNEILYGIGIFVYSEDTNTLEVILENKRLSETKRNAISCLTDGRETFIPISDLSWGDNDSKLTKLSFESNKPHAIASVTIVFYTKGFSNIPKISFDTPVDFQSNAYEAMIEKSLLSLGNNAKLKLAIEKAKLGEEVTIAYIGGSITQGAVALPLKNCYAYQSYLRFVELFGQPGLNHIHFVKAGVGGTPSELGMIRYERDVLKNGKVYPDIVIVEFAVNDADDETNGISYESLVVRALQEPNQPAVVLLFSVFFDDWNLQERFIPIGEQYKLPMVSIKNAVVDQFYLTKESGNVITKRQFFYDIYHPTNAGHTIMADSLSHLFEQVDLAETDDAPLQLDVPAVYGTDFAYIKLIDRINIPSDIQISRGSFSEIDNELQNVELDNHYHTTPQFPYNWSHTEKSGSDSFTMQLMCKKLLLVFKDSGDSQFGQVDVVINDILVKQLDAYEVKWNHCHTILLVNEQKSEHYKIELKMSVGHEHKSFTILGFGYVE